MHVTSPESLSPTMPTPTRRRTGLIVTLAAVALAAIVAAVIVSTTSASTPAARPAAQQAPQHPDGVPILPAAPVVQTATVSQYASKVSPPIKALRETYAQYKTDACAVRNTTSAPVACSFAPLAFDMEAQTLAVTLTGAAKQGVPAYIGQPPAEIKQLVGDTLYAAMDLDATVGPDGKCEQAILFASVTRLMTTLDRWDPYL